MNKSKNENYAATVVEINTLIDLENCDKVQHANIFGNLVIVSKDIKPGDIGLFFPIETQLSEEYLSANSLYRDATLNQDQTQKGYFEKNGRIRAMKFRGHNSMGLFMPLSSLTFTGQSIDSLKVGDTFDELNGKEICRKYIIKQQATPGKGQNKKGKQWEKVSVLIDNQFHFHVDTAQLGRNIHKIKPDTLIHVTRKIHGTSFISSNILCKKKLSAWDKIGKFIGMDIKETEYQNIYSSRRVVKNDTMNLPKNHYYSIDIWGKANEKVKDILTEGMTVYGEIVGYIDESKMIQKGYDYGCKPGEFEIYIYRITYTSPSGHVFEYSAKQVQQWCKLNGLKAVEEYYFGRAIDIFHWIEEDYSVEYDDSLPFQENLLNYLQEKYLEKEAHDCIHKVPDEGIVLRIEDSLDIDPYKLKSFSFYEYETKQLDKGEEDIESSNEGEN